MKAEVEPNLKKGATLAFAHGFNIHYSQVSPRDDLDIIMIAPKGTGASCTINLYAGWGCSLSYCRASR